MTVEWSIAGTLVDYFASDTIEVRPGNERTITAVIDEQNTFSTIRDYVETATGQHLYWGHTADGVWVAERGATDVVSSHIVEVLPEGDQSGFYEGFWAGILGGAIVSQPSSADAHQVVELEIVVLAHSSDYDTRDGLYNDLGPNP